MLRRLLVTSPAYWRMRGGRLERARLAWGVLTGTLTPMQARTLTCDLEAISGSYALESFERDVVLSMARERWGDVAELPDMVWSACARVASKWDCNGDNGSSAEGWAMEMIEDYAQQRGVILSDSEEV